LNIVLSGKTGAVKNGLVRYNILILFYLLQKINKNTPGALSQGIRGRVSDQEKRRDHGEVPDGPRNGIDGDDAVVIIEKNAEVSPKRPGEG
jgi:hypothetical protein